VGDVGRCGGGGDDGRPTAFNDMLPQIPRPCAANIMSRAIRGSRARRLWWARTLIGRARPRGTEWTRRGRRKGRGNAQDGRWGARRAEQPRSAARGVRNPAWRPCGTARLRRPRLDAARPTRCNWFSGTKSASEVVKSGGAGATVDEAPARMRCRTPPPRGRPRSPDDAPRSGPRSVIDAPGSGE